MSTTFTVGEEHTVADRKGNRWTGTVVENTTRIVALVTTEGERIELAKGRIDYNGSHPAGKQLVAIANHGDGKTIHKIRDEYGFTYCGLSRDRVHAVTVDVNRHLQCKKCFFPNS